MLRLPQFRYLVPQSLEEALSLLREHDGDIRIMAGGSGLLPSMKQRLFSPKYILDLKRIPGLNQIQDGFDMEIKIGPLTTMTSLENSPVIKKYFPGLSQAADSVAVTQIKNIGTIGGNLALDTRCWYFNQSDFSRESIEKCIKLGGKACHVVKGGKKCHAYFAADTVPVLIALGAQVTIRNSEGERYCDLKEIYTQDGKAPNALKPGDLITEITIPIPPGSSGNAYKKLRLRESMDFPLVGSAVQITMDGDFCRDVKIVLGAVGSGPLEVKEAEKLLKAKTITQELIEEVGKIAQKASRPFANTATSPGYRREMAGVFTKKALKEAVNRAKCS